MKTRVLFTIACFTAGFITAWFVINSRVIQPQHIKVEYYLELKPNDRVIIEDTHGNIIQCHTDSIPSVLLKDNL